MAGNLDLKRVNTLPPFNLFPLFFSPFRFNLIPSTCLFSASHSQTHTLTQANKHTPSRVKHLSWSSTRSPSIWSIEKNDWIYTQTGGRLERRWHMLLLRPFVSTATTVDSSWKQPLFEHSPPCHAPTAALSGCVTSLPTPRLSGPACRTSYWLHWNIYQRWSAFCCPHPISQHT